VLVSKAPLHNSGAFNTPAVGASGAIYGFWWLRNVCIPTGIVFNVIPVPAEGQNIYSKS